jgi:hypothetical protein
MRDDMAVKPSKIATLPSKIDRGNETKLGTMVFKHPMPCGIGGFSTSC